MSFRNAIQAGRRGLASTTLAALGAAGVAIPTAPASAQDVPAAPYDYDAALAESGIDGSYGYVRTLDGSATIVQTNGERIAIEINEPILVGDRIFVSGGSRAELVLADRNLVRIGDRAELGFQALAHSADRADPASVLELRRGTLQVVVVPGQLGREYPTVLTPNSTVQLRATGAYLIVVDGDDRTEVVVREGRADVLTDTDGAEVRPGESLFVEGRGSPRLQFAAAPTVDRLERWGNQLSEYGYVEGEYIDDDLRYSARGLDDHGTWVSVEGRAAWRPYVAGGWAPYRHGRWRYTPSGLFWVSYEPWGWVPYHYGYWDYVGAHGWIWFPGRRFAPAHVYWYWGQHYAGWVPIGYYARHYGHVYGSGFGFYFGVYGHIGGGGFGSYRYWTFCPPNRLGHRRQHFYSLQGHELARRGARLAGGILTTDTRALRPDVWRRPDVGVARLRSLGERSAGTLPDARPFVDRPSRLPAELERVALRGRAATAGSGRALDRASPTGLRERSTGVEAPPRTPVGRTPALRTRGASGPDPTARGEGIRPPTAAPRVEDRRELRRPSRPVARDARPDVRPRSEGSIERPTVRPSTRSSRPTVRPSTRSSGSRPTVRPDVRSSGTSRPTVRPSTRSSRPTVRPSTRSSRPTVRPSTRSSRPTVRPSTRSSRPTVRPSRGSGAGSRPAVRRSGGRRSGGS